MADWMPTKAEMEAVYPEELEYTGLRIEDIVAEHDRRKAMLVARKLVEEICKQGRYMELDNSLVTYPIIALAPEFLQQLRKEVGLDG